MSYQQHQKDADTAIAIFGLICLLPFIIFFIWLVPFLLWVLL